MKIAVLVGGIAYETQRRLLEGITQYAEEKNISIFVFTCNGDIYKQSEYGMGEFQIFHLPDLNRYDGIIFARDTIQSEQFAADITKRIEESGVPAVSIENDIPGMPVYYVDNREAMRDMVTHVIEMHGAKDICYLSGPKQNPESAERLKGAQDAIEAHGLKLPKERLFYGNYWIDSGKELVDTLMKQAEEQEKMLPDAIVCANDDMALGAYIELNERGVEVGKEMILTGYDHTSDATNLSPKITTVEKPQAQIGYEACKSLVEHAGETRIGKQIESRKFKVKHFYRGSCGCQDHKKRKLSKVQLKNLQQKLEIFNIAEINKNMVSDLNDCDNQQDFYECLKEYIAQLDFSFLYLCLCEDKDAEDKTEYSYQIHENYSEQIYIPVAYEEGVFTQYPYFACKDLLPQECMDKIGSQLCIVAPVHFRKNCLGYLVMCGSGLPFNSTQFQMWLMNISNALENIRKQTELKRLVKKLNSVWMLDSLTQIYNRAGFFHFADKLLKECKKHETPIGMLFVDINKLKRVNDGFGHEEGDFYIKTVADYLKKLKNDGQLLMRYGGDEFVVLGEFVTGEEFKNLLEKLNPELALCRQQHQKPYEMSVSIGFQSVSMTQDFQLDELMKQADQEMYTMKKKG
ncbi:MAG: GGDEF domain-containing protein [Muribaculaceae bacterium]|nr:GGDEF domain-containing protein [Muribaculaceae bacterium]